jgi:CDP-paratose 2-epimerase
MVRTILVTGSNGLVGRSCAERFLNEGYEVYGIDNNARALYFGSEASTRDGNSAARYKPGGLMEIDLDITNRTAIQELILRIKPHAIIHTAAQPSHDKAAEIPFLDFETNAVGTLNLIESLRQANIDGIFVHLSTNKVYGDSPNLLPVVELETRFDYADGHFKKGIDESQSIDASMHSLFGVSKLSGDILVQEYGRYFGMKTCVLRGGCLTGSNHQGVELHGFLSWLVKCNLLGFEYSIFGHKGKQVRDNLHAEDVATFVLDFVENPKVAAIYNLGGGFSNSVSILEAITLVEEASGIRMKVNYKSQARKGDHLVYYSDLSRIQSDYPSWKVNWKLNHIIDDLVRHQHVR